MKTKFLKRLIYPGLVALLLLPFFAHSASAQAPSQYGREFNLFVHQQNQGLAVPSIKGNQVLESYFLGVPLKASADDLKQFMTQRDFLIRFERLRLEAAGEESRLSDSMLYPLVWLTARRNNWLPDVNLTYKTMQDFLYRYSVSEKYGGIPYYEGLVLEEAEITPQTYPSIHQVREIREEITTHAASLRKMPKLDTEQRKLLVDLTKYDKAFSTLEEELHVLNHPVNKLPDLPSDIRQKIIDHDLNQILDQITYNYSRNNANRIHNLVTGAMQLSGRVFQPNEEMNFEKELGRNGWGIYKYGWVIFGGTEAWQFGGGLCGSATITFTPSWRAGLEIVKRYPHSVYYRSLYPEDSFGLDATIYRGGKNLIMKNTTGSPLMYYVSNDPEKKEITMYLIGNSPYLIIDIEGPIKTSWGTYKWIRRMERFDGTVVEDELITRYGLIH
jgi:hypothetical protein